jgi:hypothetical protein
MRGNNPVKDFSSARGSNLCIFQVKGAGMKSAAWRHGAYQRSAQQFFFRR